MFFSPCNLANNVTSLNTLSSYLQIILSHNCSSFLSKGQSLSSLSNNAYSLFCTISGLKYTVHHGCGLPFSN